VAVLTSGIKEQHLCKFQSRNLPTVLVDANLSLPRTVNLRVDYKRGIRQAVQHLAALGHEKIAFLTGPLSLPSAVTRKHAFEDALHEIGMRADPQLVIAGDHTLQGGMCAFGALLEKGFRPTAVMCSNDISAVGVMREAYGRRISVPDELSVIGFDDVRMAQFMVPPLTSIRISQGEMGHLAFEALRAEIERAQPSENSREYVLTTDLVLRASTALAAKKKFRLLSNLQRQ
jgi:LacI family transcriptional regulator